MSKRSDGPTTLALVMAFGPVILVLAGVGALVGWLIFQDQAKERAQQFLNKAAHMHLEDRQLAWERFKIDDPAAAKFIGQSASGRGVRLNI